jgi:hypothetical protein
VFLAAPTKMLDGAFIKDFDEALVDHWRISFEELMKNLELSDSLLSGRLPPTSYDPKEVEKRALDAASTIWRMNCLPGYALISSDCAFSRSYSFGISYRKRIEFGPKVPKSTIHIDSPQLLCGEPPGGSSSPQFT